MNEKALRSQIGNRVKMLRHSLNLTQAGFSKKLGRTQREVSTWENGKKLVPLSILFKLRELYDIPLGYFDPKDDTYFGKVLEKTMKEK